MAGCSRGSPHPRRAWAPTVNLRQLALAPVGVRRFPAPSGASVVGFVKDPAAELFIVSAGLLH